MEKAGIDISVIVPIYNVEEYLEACLESLLRQKNVSLEVILIDDGSTDGSAAIAKRYAQKYDYFHYHVIENGGAGHARNYGVQFAGGKYMIFLDSDDVVVDGAYEKMYRLAEKNNSELTICHAARFNAKKTWSSDLHNRVFHNIESDTHITKNSNLVYDTTSWNKLILRSFYLEYNFKFPENIQYCEDIPVAMGLHYFASHVAVSSDIGYLWRMRDGVIKSATQSISSNIDYLIERISIITMVNQFMAENAVDSAMNESWLYKTLEWDLMIFINVCKSVPKARVQEIMCKIKEYLESNIQMYTEKSIFEKLSIIDRQKYICLMEDDLEGLLNICEYENKGYQNAAVKEKDGRLWIELPEELFSVKDRDVTKELISREPRKYIDNITVSGGKIEISAHIYRQRINMKDSSEQKISAFLYNELTDTKIPLQAVPELAKSLTDSMGIVTDIRRKTQTSYNYDGTGFRLIISPQEIISSSKHSAWNKILVTYENRFSSGSVFLNGCSGKIKSTFHNSAYLIGECLVKISFYYLNELQIQSVREDIWIEDIFQDKKYIRCRLTHPVDSIWAESEAGNEKIPFKTGDNMMFFAPAAAFKRAIKYGIYVKTKGEIVKPLLSKKKEIKVWGNKNYAIIKSSLRTYETGMLLFNRITMLQKSDKKMNKVQLWTKTAGSVEELRNVAGARLYVDDKISGNSVILAEASCVKEQGVVRCRFEIDFDRDSIQKNFYQSIRDVYIEYMLEDGSGISESIYMPDYFRYTFSYETLSIECYRILEGTLRISITQVWREEENSQKKREALTLKNYPLYRTEKINPKQIVFESLWGSRYSCNPQALYEYIDEHYPEYECIWSLNDARTPIKGNGKRVRRGSQEYYHYLATAGYLVNNVNFTTDYVKREGQIEIQTMHGTPLKTLGLDVKDEIPTERAKEEFLEKCARWNYLIVQGKFMLQKRKAIYNFEKEVLCTGYPRTDRFFKADKKKIEKIKQELKLPENKKIILYAPTWRIRNQFNMKLDLEKMREKLSDDYILLVRIHYLAASGYIIPEDKKFIFDFNFYRYAEDLYLISDILITDYSSVMFDYALLKKPMLFFVYDLEDYCDKLRGLYIDFTKEAPGPLLYHSDEVISAILHLEEEMEKCKGRIEDFQQKFLTYEGPDSCKQVVDAVFHPAVFDRKRILYKVKKILRTLNNARKGHSRYES